MSRGPEQRLAARVREWIREQPDVWGFKVHGGRFQRAGVADYILSVRGIFVAVELKAPGEEPTPKQVRELRLVRRAGGLGIVAESLPEIILLADAIRAEFVPAGVQKAVSEALREARKRQRETTGGVNVQRALTFLQGQINEG